VVVGLAASVVAVVEAVLRVVAVVEGLIVVGVVDFTGFVGGVVDVAEVVVEVVVAYGPCIVCESKLNAAHTKTDRTRTAKTAS
jgi:hypothetical protein